MSFFYQHILTCTIMHSCSFSMCRINGPPESEESSSLLWYTLYASPCAPAPDVRHRGVRRINRFLGEIITRWWLIRMGVIQHYREILNTDYGYKASWPCIHLFALSHSLRVLFFFGICIRDSLPYRITSCTAEESAVPANETEKKKKIMRENTSRG